MTSSAAQGLQGRVRVRLCGRTARRYGGRLSATAARPVNERNGRCTRAYAIAALLGWRPPPVLPIPFAPPLRLSSHGLIDEATAASVAPSVPLGVMDCGMGRDAGHDQLNIAG